MLLPVPLPLLTWLKRDNTLEGNGLIYHRKHIIAFVLFVIILGGVVRVGIAVGIAIGVLMLVIVVVMMWWWLLYWPVLVQISLSSESSLCRKPS